jgi:hypothetical protein
MVWSRGVVLNALDEALYVKRADVADQFAEWTEIDSDLIAPIGTHTTPLDPHATSNKNTAEASADEVTEVTTSNGANTSAK